MYYKSFNNSRHLKSENFAEKIEEEKMSMEMAVAMVSDELKRTALQLYKEEAQSLFCFKHLKCCR